MARKKTTTQTSQKQGPVYLVPTTQPDDSAALGDQPEAAEPATDSGTDSAAGVPFQPRPASFYEHVDAVCAEINAALDGGTIDKLLEKLTDATRLKSELEQELVLVKKDLTDRIKLLSARISDVVQQVEDMTHVWVLDVPKGLAYLVHKDSEGQARRALELQDTEQLTALSKTVRPMKPSEAQVELEF